MFVTEVKRLLTKEGFKEVELINSGTYTYYLWQKGLLLVLIEEAHSFNLTGKVNLISMSARFAEEDYQGILQIVSELPLSGCLVPIGNQWRMSFTNFNGLDSLKSTLSELLSLPMQCGQVKWWNSGINDSVPFELS